MAVVALVVAIVSALAAGAAAVYARRLDETAKEAVAAARDSAKAAERSAIASETRAVLEGQRRHAELTPRFRVTVERLRPGWGVLQLTVFLAGPPDLGRVDSLTVRIRDDDPWRFMGDPVLLGRPREEMAAQIWGPYRFTAPPDWLEGDATGRVGTADGMPVGEPLTFRWLQPTRPPEWSVLPVERWRELAGTVVRLQLECSRGGESWSLPCEVDVASLPVTVEVP
jgi:hypothetical protein